MSEAKKSIETRIIRIQNYTVHCKKCPHVGKKNDFDILEEESDEHSITTKYRCPECHKTFKKTSNYISVW